MEFKKYQHVERYGTTEVENIEVGMTYVFPKIDGTNSSVWLDNKGIVQCGSRNRQLSLEKDNAGFYVFVNTSNNIQKCLFDNPKLRLYGEWLVPHSLRTYRDNAWRRFYVFDVMEEIDNETERYLPYEEYRVIMERYGLDYILPLCVIQNATYDSYINQLEKNVFLIQDGKGCGEGIVIKNYNYKNKYGRIVWAKIITSEFKEKHIREMQDKDSPSQGKKLIEQEIIDKYITIALCEKVRAKIIEEKGEWNSKLIPMLLNMVYYDLVQEDCWHFIKENKFPTIDFKKLMSLCYYKTKELLNL